MDLPRRRVAATPRPRRGEPTNKISARPPVLGRARLARFDRVALLDVVEVVVVVVVGRSHELRLHAFLLLPVLVVDVERAVGVFSSNLARVPAPTELGETKPVRG